MLRGVLVASLIAITAPHVAHAQGAWVGDPKSLSADFAYSYVPSSAVVVTPDMEIGDRPTQNHIFTLGAEYVPIENLSIDAEVPLAVVKYTGTQIHIPPGKWDDGKSHTTLTDLRLGARYQLLDEPYAAVSPFFAVSVPMMDYEVIGFATGGRHLKQAHVGVSVGRTLAPYVPNLFAMASYELTLSERYDLSPATEHLTQNRSDVEAQVGYLFLDGDLVINVATNYRRHHGGIDFERFPKLPPELTLNHDPILREEYLFLGGGASYAINRTFTVGAVVRMFIQGYNTRDQSFYGVDLTWRVL